MKFYNRGAELKELHLLYRQSSSQGRLTVLTGRRRVGKTMLSLQFARKHRHLYFFVSRKTEPLLCEEYLVAIKNTFDVPIIGQIRTFKDIFRLLLEISFKKRFTLIIDEFQEFYTVNPTIYADIQHLWDINKHESRMNLILVGSVYSLMCKIFQNSKEPLFNRADRQLYVAPFSIRDTATILKDHNNRSVKTLFDYYVFTGGMPAYIDLLLTNKALSFNAIIDFILSYNSPFLDEGKNVLIEEFGKDYGTYFSILELISVGKTARTEIESILERNVGGFLDRLEQNFAIISKQKPINAKPNSRLQKYKIQDNFFNIWFPFIYRNRSAIENGNFEYVKNIIKRDYNAYCGRILEKFFRELFAASGRFNDIGSYWERDNHNEIDIVAVNEMEKEIVIAEVKFRRAKINLDTLRGKSAKVLRAYPNCKPEFLALSFEDIDTYL